MAAEVHRTANVPEWKKKEVALLIEKIGQSRVVGVVGMREIPASDLQQMKGELRSSMEIKMVRNSIAKRAIEGSSSEVKPLADYVEDQSALVFSDVNPFKLYKMLESAKRPMPIKAGGIAPREIAIEAGETSFSPGPMVGKLQAAGIPAAIKGGKVVINQRTVLAKEGEVVSAKTADILKTLEIFPRKIGLDLKAVYEGGLVFPAKDLAVDVDAMVSSMAVAAAKAFSFAVEVGYVTPDTISPILQRAQAKARGLVMEAGIPVPGMMDLVLMKAAANAQAINRAISGEAAPAAAPSAKGEKAKDAKPTEEEKEKEEEMGVEGLSALFG
jgi:large subunit ribosomal protein L10